MLLVVRCYKNQFHTVDTFLTVTRTQMGLRRRPKQSSPSRVFAASYTVPRTAVYNTAWRRVGREGFIFLFLS